MEAVNFHTRRRKRFQQVLEANNTSVTKYTKKQLPTVFIRCLFTNLASKRPQETRHLCVLYHKGHAITTNSVKRPCGFSHLCVLYSTICSPYTERKKEDSVSHLNCATCASSYREAISETPVRKPCECLFTYLLSYKKATRKFL